MRETTGRTSRPARGFTLTELMVVIAIVGILITFILIAASDGIRRAEERATQSLIAKLEMGLSERIEAILTRRADISLGHQYLAAVINPNFPTIINVNDPNYLFVQALNTYFNTTSFNTSILSQQRAQAIAQFDRYRADLPDVFFVQAAINPTYGALYPLNFAGGNFPVNGTDNYLIPIGAYSTPTGAPGTPTTGSEPGDPNQAVGIFGATWQAAGGIYKNLGYLPQGYDGADNNNNGLIDEWSEGIGADPQVADPDNPAFTIHLSALINRRLAAHKHNTARSEMLYALLVEGIGPLGSVFSRDEFSSRQVADTDNDGLPEFVDAWGQPLQFFRWPIYYNNLSSTSATPGTIGFVQKGADLYNGLSEPRQIDPLDPNQTLTSIVWWANPPNGSAGSGTAISAPATTFQSLFHSLTDPNYSPNATLGTLWDRSGVYARRAFYSRFLILSGGPDQTPGVARLFSANESPNSMGALFGVTDNSGGVVALNAQNLIQIENEAAALDPANRAANQTTSALIGAGGDDITNQSITSPTGGSL